MAYTPKGQTRTAVFAYVRAHLASGASPTVREVQQHFGFRSIQSARSHLEALVAVGALDKAEGVGRSRPYRLPRSLRVIAGPPAPARVPLLGRVAAGSLDLAEQHIEGYLLVPDGRSAERFALRVRGASMRDAGILSGDVVLVRRQTTARSGDVVVALVGDEATIKTYWRRAGQVVLEPANPDFEPLVLPPDQVAILGKVVEVRRYLDGGVPLVDGPEESRS